MKIIIQLVGALFCLSSVCAWIPNHARLRPRTKLFDVELISLESLNNPEEDGSRMAESIVKWLDTEWLPQQVHVDMAESAKQTYIVCRESGKDDLADIMMQVSNDLHDNWQLYDKDAFINAWDVGNYVADYLTKRAGVEGCACSEEIF